MEMLSLCQHDITSLAIIDIVPGTVIYAPREMGKIQGLSFAATLAPIISSVALSLASLNSIND